MLIEIVGNNQSFFRRVNAKAFEQLARSVPAVWTLAELDRLHSELWKLGKPAKISSTGDVEFTVVDDTNDIESCQDSWHEIFQEYIDNPDFECDHPAEKTFDRRGHLCCECGAEDV